MNHKRLITGTLSALLVISTLSANEHCTGTACFINLDNLKPTREVVHEKSEHKTHSFVVANNSQDIIVDGEDTIVLPSYVMTPEEKAAYYREQRAIALNQKANEEANRELESVIQPIEKVEDRILNENLPTSDYFCDNDKKPIRVNNSDIYECV